MEQPTNGDLWTAKRIVRDAGVTGVPSDRGLTKLINVCQGWAWGGCADDWPDVLGSVASAFVKAMLEGGLEPDIRSLVMARHRLTRHYAWGQTPDGRVEVWE